VKRRTFCASAAAAIGAAVIPYRRAFGAVTSAASDISAVTGDGRRVALPCSDIDELRAGLRGQLLLPEQPGYDEARRIWNGMFDRRPALIARCAGAADVVRSVSFARSHELLVAVRGGGHSLSGQSSCDDGLMIDLSPMQSVRVDPADKLARVEPGVLLGALDRESHAFGLATTTGTVSHTGAAGLTLGGGFGRLSRRFSMACDNVRAVDIVTADGRLLRADSSENPDLYWGARGGGGNFGVVTSFEYHLHPFDHQVYGGHLVFPFAQARALLRGYADAWHEAPEELWIEPVLVKSPSGERLAVLDVCYSGPLAAAEDVVAPFRKLGTPHRDELRPLRFIELQTADDARARFGRRYYSKVGIVEKLDDDLIDAAIGAHATSPIRSPRIAISPHGGAMGRVERSATAYWHRGASHSVIMQTSGDDPSEDAGNMAWVRSSWPAIEPFTRGFYANINQADLEKNPARGAYGGNLERLVAIKNRYDPTNLFRLNANVRPTG
jgi:FAD/FMN-containing dehydrogenase